MKLFEMFEELEPTILVELTEEVALEELSAEARNAQNIKGSSKNSPSCSNCGPWIDHWINITKQQPTRCAVHRCTEPRTREDLEGGHVKHAGKKSGAWFIVPLCSTHNKETSPFKILTRIKTAPANVAESCGKSKK